MKKILIRSENVLLLWLMVLPVVAFFMEYGSAIDTTHIDKFNMQPILNKIWLQIIAWILIAYTFHFLARFKHSRIRTGGKIHILLTIYTSINIIQDFYAHVPLIAIQSPERQHLTEIYFSMSHNPPMLMFIFLQVVFILVVSVRLLLRPKAS